MKNEQRTGKNRIDDIEVLRAVAILMVLVAHCNALYIWNPAWFATLSRNYQFWGGVDLFFVISGFVIAKSLLPVLKIQANIKGFWCEVIAFWIRRAYRLLPSAWFWVAFVLLCSAFSERSNFFGPLDKDLLDTASILAQINNFHLAQWFCCQKGVYGTGVLGIFWSLSLEEQFYLLLPLLILLLRWRIVPFLIIIILIQFLLPRSWPSPFFYFRTDALALGVLIACSLENPVRVLFEPEFLQGSAVARWALLVFFIFLLAIMGTDNVVWFNIGMLAVISATLVWIASFDKNYIAPRGILRKALLWVGSRSYAIYLIHLPIFTLTHEIWFRIEPEGTLFNGHFTLRYTFTGLILLGLFSELSYRFLEKPLRLKGRKASHNFTNRCDGHIVSPGSEK